MKKKIEEEPVFKLIIEKYCISCVDNKETVIEHETNKNWEVIQLLVCKRQNSALDSLFGKTSQVHLYDLIFTSVNIYMYMWSCSMWF